MIKEFEKRLLSSFILIPIAIFFIIQGSVFFIFFLSILFLVTSYEWLKMNKQNDLMKIFGILFLLFSFYTAFNLRESDLNFFLFIIIVCVFTDIGGYVFGKIFKGPKLTRISPNKTYSGMIGGFFLSVSFACLYLNYYNYYIIEKAKIISFYDFLFVITLSFVSQIGDLIISYFKRKSKIKNTGKIIPGHGGMLDRIDGMIFAFPSAYIILKIIN